ncbi:uncharacterized protein LOC113576798 [Electrophorus electricus]|uniref:uncharacterized protein LOC113576798 n=1 Tax=Electrophorus electricus TaxID=8005 RepID=UPI0015CF9C8C|nr:uncharacterized protein LOC113576798 [Electrophorus electricus]
MATLTVRLALTSFLLGLSFPRTVSANDRGRVQKQAGDTLNMECTTKKDQESFCLIVMRSNKPKVQYYYDSKAKQLNTSEDYSKRVKTFGNLGNLTISIKSLQQKDSGLYLCHYYSKQKDEEMEADDVFLVVEEGCPEKAAVPESLLLVIVVIACGVLLLCTLAVVVWLGDKVKALCVNQGNTVSRTCNPVYEDMAIHRDQLKD